MHLDSNLFFQLSFNGNQIKSSTDRTVTEAVDLSVLPPSGHNGLTWKDQAIWKGKANLVCLLKANVTALTFIENEGIIKGICCWWNIVILGLHLSPYAVLLLYQQSDLISNNLQSKSLNPLIIMICFQEIIQLFKMEAIFFFVVCEYIVCELGGALHKCCKAHLLGLIKHWYIS